MQLSRWKERKYPHISLGRLLKNVLALPGKIRFPLEWKNFHERNCKCCRSWENGHTPCVWEWSPACGIAASCPWCCSVLVTQTLPGRTVKHIPISFGILWWWAGGWRFTHTAHLDIQGYKVTSVFLDIGLFPQIHCIPLGKRTEPQWKCDLLIQITLGSSSEECEAVKENTTAQDSLFWGHRTQNCSKLKTAASLDGYEWVTPSFVASSWFAESSCSSRILRDSWINF